MEMPRAVAAVVLLVLLTGCAPPPMQADAASGEAGAQAAGRPVDPFLETLQRRTFEWFWDTANPKNGLVPDRWPDINFSSIAAIGFGLTAYGVGAARGYVTREQARDRTLATLRFLRHAPQSSEPRDVTGYRGLFYHFLDMERGRRFQNTELSTIDTALLMAGVLFAQSYFDREDPGEKEIRDLADSLFRRVEWSWMQPRPPLIAMAWRPGEGMTPHDYKGYEEAMILYVMALGSPTHPISPDAWKARTANYKWERFYGYDFVNYAPLFIHQYSHIWIDFRGIQDAYIREKGIDYFENSRRATYAQRAYATDNPNRFRDYGENVWGLTACIGPQGGKAVIGGRHVQFHGYWARGASSGDIRDDGTIAPTAAGGSLPFAPEIVLPALEEMERRYGGRLFRRYGFVDAFNPTFPASKLAPGTGAVTPEGWFADDYLGIDQGPIVLMAENHRSGLVWEVMKKNPYIVRGLCRAGFRGGWIEGRCDEPAGVQAASAADASTPQQTGERTIPAPPGMVHVPGGTTRIGADDGSPDERPAFVARVNPFFMDAHPVTVAAFRAFVEATGHVTDAERHGDGGVLDLRTGEWRLVPRATWRRPMGLDKPPASEDHPVTQVSWRDASAYARWAGKRLPTEIEWEHAARGGRDSRTRYPWGDAPAPGGRYRANTWQGAFPGGNTMADGFAFTSPVGSFGPTVLGLSDMAGNVWEWTSDWYRPYAERDRPFQPRPASEKVQRGGSFLCGTEFCHGYRVSARSHATPDTALFHVGFRCARDLRAR